MNGLSLGDLFQETELNVFGALNLHLVPYIIDGGVGCLFHNARALDTKIKDIDIILSPDAESAAKLGLALSQCARNLGFSWEINSSDAAKPNVQFKYLHEQFDFRTCASVEKFNKLQSNSVLGRVAGHAINVMGISDLIEMKLAAVTSAPTESRKHLQDVERLRLRSKELARN